MSLQIRAGSRTNPRKRAAAPGTVVDQLLGTCGFCGRAPFVLDDKLRLHDHGFERPGWGHLVGGCPGAREVCQEVSPKTLKMRQDYLLQRINNADVSILSIEAATVLYKDDYTKPKVSGLYQQTPVHAGTYEFRELQSRKLKGLQYQRVKDQTLLTETEQELRDWQPTEPIDSARIQRDEQSKQTAREDKKLASYLKAIDTTRSKVLRAFKTLKNKEREEVTGKVKDPYGMNSVSYYEQIMKNFSDLLYGKPDAQKVFLDLNIPEVLDHFGIAGYLTYPEAFGEIKRARAHNRHTDKPWWPGYPRTEVRKNSNLVNPTAVEYAVQYLYKRKSVSWAAQETARKLNGSENMFLGPGVVQLDPRELEEAVWGRLVDYVEDSIKKLNPAKTHFALDFAADTFNQKSATFRKELKKRTEQRLGNVFPYDDA